MSIEARCVRIRESGGPEVLELGTTEVRDPGPGEVRVAVAAAGLNRADTLQRRGFYPAPKGFPDDVPGLELAGTVETLGEGVEGFTVGDPVMAIIGGGGMATHAVVHSRELLPVPGELSLEEAAAIPEVFLTAFDALFAQGDLRMGETVLLHAVASGVGTAALQLAQLTGARVIGTSRSTAKLERCAELGLAHPIDTSDGTFADAVRELGGANLVIDTIGAKYLSENLKALALRGRIVVLGLMGGVKGEMPLGLLLEKRARMVGSTLRARPLEEKAALAQRFIQEVLPHFREGRLKPVIDDVLPMSEVGEAHARMERNETFGKLVLRWD